ncbi:MAG: N-acyl-D-amino-acid deacylase family protein [Gemmatimonadota bacterium]
MSSSRWPLAFPLLFLAPVIAGSSVSFGGATTLAAQDAEGSYDWLIRGGSVVDGTGSPSRLADVLLREDRIAHVGGVDPDTLRVERVFDARGLVVAPGFIDLHAHGDPVADPSFENFLAQGATTIVLGQDGSSPEAGSFADHLEGVGAARPSVNVAYLVGHNTVRRESGVGFGDPDPEGLEGMAALVRQALDAGAFGLSTGLEYNPGGRAGPEELAAIAEPVGERGAVVMSHLRSEDEDRVDGAVEELLDQGRRSGAAVHVSHMKIVLGADPEAAERILALMAAARDDGLQVTGDVYPYLASFTGISLLFPDWALAPNDYDTVVRNRREELAAHLRRRVESRNGPEATLFGSGRWSGRTLSQVAEEEGRPFEEVLVDLGPGGARAAYFVMDEDVMTTFLADSRVAVSSDGSPTMAHPRGYGAFARVIRRYVLEQGLLTLEEAVRKMTSLPAAILDLDDRVRVEVPVGVVRDGWAADLVVFDPEGVEDRATFEEPHLPAVGMEAVWVRGEPAWMDGGPVAGRGHGRMIRRR